LTQDISHAGYLSQILCTKVASAATSEGYVVCVIFL